MKSRLVSLKRELFHCEKDAREAFDIVMGTDKERIFEADVNVFMDKRIHKEDPDGPCWRAYFSNLRIDEEALDRAATEYSVNVLVTNIPSANVSEENLRFGATADDIVDIYIEEYSIEHVFRLGKSGLGVDHMFLHTPSRQDSVVFLTSIASMVSGAIDILLKKGTPNGKRALTMKSICDRKANTVLRYGRENDSVTILGEPGDQDCNSQIVLL
jgi:transposase